MLTANYTNASGAEHTVEAETLPEIQAELLDAGYEGGTLTVFDDAGWVRGWVSAETYRYA